jgi:hypothetical protein
MAQERFGDRSTWKDNNFCVHWMEGRGCRNLKLQCCGKVHLASLVHANRCHKFLRAECTNPKCFRIHALTLPEAQAAFREMCQLQRGSDDQDDAWTMTTKPASNPLSDAIIKAVNLQPQEEDRKEMTASIIRTLNSYTLQHPLIRKVLDGICDDVQANIEGPAQASASRTRQT